jgi:soluble lytic murein transglycosylase
MPYTAKEVARKMKIKYSPSKLKKSAKYNIKLGSYYINSLLERFDNSKIMAIASYNAGPNAVRRWVREFYDPREKQDINKIIDWIELITYSETRNYVHRIMENLVIYEALLNK